MKNNIRTIKVKKQKNRLRYKYSAVFLHRKRYK